MSQESNAIQTLVAYGRGVVRGEIEADALDAPLAALWVRSCEIEWDGASFEPRTFFEALRESQSMPAMNAQHVLEVRDARGVRWFGSELRRGGGSRAVLACRAAPLQPGAARHVARAAITPTLEEAAASLGSALRQAVPLIAIPALGEALRVLDHGADAEWLGFPSTCPRAVRALAAAAARLEGIDDARADWRDLVGPPREAVLAVESARRWAIPVAASSA